MNHASPEVPDVGVALKAVVPIRERTSWIWQLVSAELYEGGVVIRWLGTTDEPPHAHELAPPVIGLEDDQGTNYVPCGVGWFGNRAIRGESLFTPRFPAEASILVVVVGKNQRVQIKASDAGGLPGPPASSR